MSGPLLVRLSDPCDSRLDRALIAALPPDVEISRTRLRQLIEAGFVHQGDGAKVTSPSMRVNGGEEFVIEIPPPTDPIPRAEAIPLMIVHEDTDLIVVDKPAGMVVHPAPGAESGTLVNALLHHCGAELSGIGGVRRPGIVHRIDKDTSGLLVVAKSDRAHQGLARLFASHTIERSYVAFAHGALDLSDPKLQAVSGVSLKRNGLRIETEIGRHPGDRTRMAVVKRDGRRAVTHVDIKTTFGNPPAVTELLCRLETGRTHQIRVHLAHAGHPLIGDPVYGKGRTLSKQAFKEADMTVTRNLARQALHAAELGFQHPVSGLKMCFASQIPADLADMVRELRRD